MGESKRGLVVLVFPRISQLDVMICLMGGSGGSGL